MRDVDLHFDWHANDIAAADLKDAQSFIKDQKAQWGDIPEEELNAADHRKLRGSQQQVFLQVMAHARERIAALIEGRPEPEPLRINVDGTAGTGKSFLISAICSGLRSLANEYGFPNPVARLAPTGVAGFNILGSTLHFALGLGVERNLKDLSASRLKTLQERWKDTYLFIIDEKSMVGRVMLGKVSKRLQSFFPAFTGDLLGGRSMLLFGDFAQLPPVGDTSLFVPTPSCIPGSLGALSTEGLNAYRTFKQSVELTHVFRQAGTDQAQVTFRDSLMRVRDYESVQEDIDMFATRFWENLSPDEKDSFRNELHLLPRTQDVEEYNTHRLAALNQPIVRCKARNSCAAAERASDKLAQGLPNRVLLAEGAHVMLTRNLWTSRGLVNGARGIVDKIVYAPSADPREDSPAVIFVRFPRYTGETDPRWRNPAYPDDPVVPIVPHQVQFEDAGQNMSRTQYPLVLAYAISIHKSQGLTLERAVIELGTKDFSMGLSFVAISRVKSLAGIAFRSPFALSRLRRPPSGTQRHLLNDSERRAQVGFTLNPYGQDISMYTFDED